MLNIYKDNENKLKWKSGIENSHSVVIADITISDAPVTEYMKGVGTAGWAPPEQWLGQFMKW